MTNSPERMLMPQEVSKDTSAIAENEALKKVIDIYGEPSLKHSFYRYPSITNNSVDRLKGIFRYGIISQNFAKRIKANFISNYHDPTNLKGVSIVTQHVEISQAFGNAIKTQIQTLNQDLNIKITDSDIKLPIQNIIVVLISTDIDTYSTLSSYIPPNEGEPERLRAHRIKQRQFKGIVIIDSETTPDPNVIYSKVPCSENIDWHSSTSLNTARIAVNGILEAYKYHPSLAIPVYGSSGALYWPKHISYHDMQQLYSPKEEAR